MENGTGPHGAAQASAQDLTRKNVTTIALMEKASQRHRTPGDRVADAFAAAVGSWTFIITQSLLLVGWLTLNVLGWIRHWDPYPFILLNLALSFQAAYASPIIMMSQNRQARLSERRNHLDLQINLLAEQETTEILRLLRRLCAEANIPVNDEPTIEALEESTDPDELVRQIEETVEHRKPEDLAELHGETPEPVSRSVFHHKPPKDQK